MDFTDPSTPMPDTPFSTQLTNVTLGDSLSIKKRKSTKSTEPVIEHVKKSMKERTHDDIAIVRYRNYLSDYTRIQGVRTWQADKNAYKIETKTWAQLKADAMVVNFTAKDWFIGLGPDEQRLVSMLRNAQKHEKEEFG